MRNTHPFPTLPVRRPDPQVHVLDHGDGRQRSHRCRHLPASAPAPPPPVATAPTAAATTATTATIGAGQSAPLEQLSRGRLPAEGEVAKRGGALGPQAAGLGWPHPGELEQGIGVVPRGLVFYLYVICVRVRMRERQRGSMSMGKEREANSWRLQSLALDVVLDGRERLT